MVYGLFWIDSKMDPCWSINICSRCELMRCYLSISRIFVDKVWLLVFRSFVFGLFFDLISFVFQFLDMRQSIYIYIIQYIAILEFNAKHFENPIVLKFMRKLKNWKHPNHVIKFVNGKRAMSRLFGCPLIEGANRSILRCFKVSASQESSTLNQHHWQCILNSV